MLIVTDNTPVFLSKKDYCTLPMREGKGFKCNIYRKGVRVMVYHGQSETQAYAIRSRLHNSGHVFDKAYVTGEYRGEGQ